MISLISQYSRGCFTVRREAKWTALLLLCCPLAATLSFVTAVASVPAGTGLWGRVCTLLLWYVFLYGGYLAPFVGLAGAAASLWAAYRSPRRTRVLLGWALLAVLHLLLAWWSRLVFQMLMSV